MGEDLKKTTREGLVEHMNVVDTTLEGIAPLREWRLRRHLSHRQLAKLAGVTTYTLLRIEKGHPTRPLTRRKIADALELPEIRISEFLQEM